MTIHPAIQRSHLPQLIYNRETKQWVAAQPKKKLPKFRKVKK